jgi:hypothetical protein
MKRLQFSGGEYVVTGAGNISFMGMASDMIAARLRKDKKKFSGDLEKCKDQFANAVREEILAIHQRHIASYPYQDAPPWFTLILGVQFFNRTDSVLGLLHCAGDGGVYWSEEDIFEGSGAEIARLFSNVLCGERLPIDVMRPISIFCVHQAKLGAIGCGGGSHTFTLPTPKSGSIWDEEGISELPHMASMVTSKAANGGHFKTGQRMRPGTRWFYANFSCSGKPVFVRQLRGPHLRT